MTTNTRFDDIKGMIRRIEVILEIAVLVVVYYAVWRIAYGDGAMHPYLGRGKFHKSGTVESSEGELKKDA